MSRDGHVHGWKASCNECVDESNEMGMWMWMWILIRSFSNPVHTIDTMPCHTYLSYTQTVNTLATDVKLRSKPGVDRGL